MSRAFPKPARPMGEAWFMGTERKMYPTLRGDLDALPDDEIAQALEEIITGTTSFGPLEEWIEWYHFLLPRLILRNWEPTYYQPGESLITAFMAQHADPSGEVPYRGFQADALRTLGQFIMSPRFWPDGELNTADCLSKWTGPTGIAGWADAGNLLSASLFFCIKFLAQSDVEPWFRSVIAIPNRYWQVQIMTWLVGAHPILTGEIHQPSEFSQSGPFGVTWNWSHALDGHYSGNHEPPIRRTPFLSPANSDVVVQIARSQDVEQLLETCWTDPAMSAVTAEAAGVPERFLQLYRSDTIAR